MSTEAKRRNALVNTANAGYRFRFGDTSDSRMAPAVINIGPIPDGMRRITGSNGAVHGQRGEAGPGLFRG